MKRLFTRLLFSLAGAALFAALVYAVMVVGGVSDPAATSIHGPTARRIWATSVALLGLSGVIVGGLALSRNARWSRIVSGRLGAGVVLAAGAIAAVNGGFVVASAKGGPGTGNGVVGGAAAFVLGLVALCLGVLALARSRRAAPVTTQQNRGRAQTFPPYST